MRNRAVCQVQKFPLSFLFFPRKPDSNNPLVSFALCGGVVARNENDFFMKSAGTKGGISFPFNEFLIFQCFFGFSFFFIPQKLIGTFLCNGTHFDHEPMFHLAIPQKTIEFLFSIQLKFQKQNSNRIVPEIGKFDIAVPEDTKQTIRMFWNRQPQLCFNIVSIGICLHFVSR